MYMTNKKSNSKYMILPGSGDLNRGDQALVWETRKCAEAAGYVGDYYLISKDKFSKQSQDEGFLITSSLLEHPSRKSSSKDNIKYSSLLIVKWGIVAIFDFIKSYLLLNKFSRSLIKPFLSKKKIETLNLMEECDAFFIKGGGFMHSYGGITAPYAIYFNMYHVKLALSLKKKVIIMPNSFGPFKGLGVNRNLRKIFNKCTLVFARESISSKCLKEEMNLNIEYLPDLAFSLEKNSISLNDMKEQYKIPEGRRLVAITARPYRFPEYHNGEELYMKYINSLSDMVVWLHNNGYHALLIEHTIATRHHESDILCLQEITKNVDSKAFTLISDENYTCRDLKAIYGNCDFVIGTRFHSDIFAMSECIPALAISYEGYKSMGIMQDMGLSDYCIAMNEVTSKNLIERFELLVNNEEKVKIQLNQYKKRVKEDHQKLVKLIEATL